MSNSIEKNINLNNQNTSKILEVLLIFACIFSNLSQLPIEILSDLSKFITFGMWFFLLFFSFVLYGKKIRLNGLIYLVPLIIFDILIIILQLFTGIKYTSSALFYPVHLSAFIFSVSYICGQFLSEKSFANIMKYYILSALIVGIYIFFTYFLGVEWLHSPYVYGAKNSVSQILLFATILVYMYGFFNKNILKFSVILIFIFFMLALKSRAVLIGLVLVIFYLVIFNKKNYIVKCASIFFLFVSIIAVFAIEPLFDFFIESIFFNNTMNYDLNSISSNRISHFFRFIEEFEKSPVLGHGYIYVESFPLSSLVCFGICSGVILIIFAFIPLFICFKSGYGKNKSSIYHILMMFNIVTLSNSIFEELAPFGPGVKCYMLWLIAGIYLAMQEKEKIYETATKCTDRIKHFKELKP